MQGRTNNVHRHDDAGASPPASGGGTCGQGDDDALDGWLRGAGRIAESRRGSRQADVLARVRRGLGFVSDDVIDDDGSGSVGDDDHGHDDPPGPAGGIGPGDDLDGDDLEEPELTIEQRLTLAEVEAKLGFAAEPVMIGRYQIIRRIDSGGMGVVYQAWDEKAGRHVALKRLHTFGHEHDAALEASARQEVKAMAALRHDNVVVVHDLYEDGPLRVIVMEYVEGQTLREWLNMAFWGLSELLEVFLAIASGLGAIHRAGFFHGDLKLENVLIDDEGKPRIVDFGMAARVGQDAVGGTLEYLASELLRSGDADDKSAGPEAPQMDLADQYSFCVMLFLALAERHPYLGEAEFKETLRRSNVATPPAEVRRQYRTRLSESQRRRSIRWPDPRIRRVPRWLRRLLHQGLAADPRDRFASMAALAHALHHPERVTRWRRRSVLAAGALAVGAALTGGYVRATMPRPCEDVAATLSGVWDPEIRGAIEERDPEAVTLLGAYSDRWVAVRKDTCEATFIKEDAPEAVLSARYACLDRRRDELAALVDAEKVGTITAFRASSLLRDPEPCAAVDVAPDRETADSEEARGRLRHDLRAAEIRGDFEGGREIADAAIADATSNKFFPLLAEARYERGRLGLVEVTLVRDDDALRAAANSDLQAAIAIAGDLGDQALLLEARIFAGRIAAARGVGVDALDSLVHRAMRLGPGLHRQLEDLQGMIAYRQALASEGEEKVDLLHRARDLYLRAIEGHRTAADGYAEAKAQENLGDVYKELDEAIASEKPTRAQADSEEPSKEQAGSKGPSKEQAAAAAAYARASELWRRGMDDNVPALGTLFARRIDVVPDTEEEVEVDAEAKALCREADRWLAAAELAPASRRRVDAEIALACLRLQWSDGSRARGYIRRALAADLPPPERVAALILAAEIMGEDPDATSNDLKEALDRLDEADRLLAALPEIDREMQVKAGNLDTIRNIREALTQRINKN